MNTVMFDKKKLARFKKAIKKAEAEKQEMFVFEGGEYLVTYAKYMAEYLTKQFAGDPT